MQAFHNDENVKHKYLTRVREHQLADEIIQGYGYWKSGKGCAVGCTLHSDNHAAYETELGIPEWLARVEDALFEGMSVQRSKTWPADFLSAIKPGANLETVKAPFVVFILEGCIASMEAAQFDKEKNPDVVAVIAQSKAAVIQMIEAHKTGSDFSAARSAARSAAWSARSAESAARSAAESAESAARSAAWSAAESAARSAAWSAESAAWSARSAESAESAAWSAESAARSAAWSAAESAESAAWSAAWSAESAAWSAESAAWSAARSAAYERYADKLLELIGGVGE